MNSNKMEIINAGTRVFQNTLKTSIRLPVINNINPQNEDYFINKIKEMGLEIVSTNKSFIIVEKILKKVKTEDNIVFLTPRDEWFVDEKFIFSSSPELLKFEAQVEELNQEMIQSENSSKKESELSTAKILIFPQR